MRVRVNGNVVIVATHSDLVTVFTSTGAGDPELMKRVAAHLETAMASGKYDGRRMTTAATAVPSRSPSRAA